MENNNVRPDSSIEKAKALFEYEMTSVLLAFKEDQKKTEELRKKYARYAEMEIEKPRVVYEAPGFTPRADCSVPQTPSAAAQMDLPEVTAEISGIPQTGETAPFAAPEMPEVPKPLSAFLPQDAVRTERFALGSIPEQDKLTEDISVKLPAAELSAAGLADAGKARFSPVMPEIGEIPQMSPPAFSVRTEMTLSAPEMPPAAEKPALPGINAAAKVSAPQIRLPEQTAVSIRDIPAQTAVPKLSADFPDTAPAAAVSFSEPEASVHGETFGQADVPDVSGMKPPDGLLPEINVSADTGADVSFELKRPRFTPAAAEPVRVSVSYAQPAQVSFETAKAPQVTMTAPAYPEIPDKPDITAAADEILEAVRAEI